MPAYELHRNMDLDRAELSHFSVAAEDVIISTTATSPGDVVEVTFPNSDQPDLREAVNWRVGVKVVGGVLQARYPQRDELGAVIQTDSGALWLIW